MVPTYQFAPRQAGLDFDCGYLRFFSAKLW